MMLFSCWWKFIIHIFELFKLIALFFRGIVFHISFIDCFEDLIIVIACIYGFGCFVITQSTPYIVLLFLLRLFEIAVIFSQKFNDVLLLIILLDVDGAGVPLFSKFSIYHWQFVIFYFWFYMAFYILFAIADM